MTKPPPLLNEQDALLQNGSKKFAVAVSDGIASVRDAILLLLTTGVTYLGEHFIEGGLEPQFQAAVVIVLFGLIKFCWKYFTDTQRISLI